MSDDPDDYINVVIVYPVKRKYLPPVTPDSGYPPIGVHPRNAKAAMMVQMDDASANPTNVVVVHFKKSPDLVDQGAVALAEAARSAWNTSQFHSFAMAALLRRPPTEEATDPRPTR